MPLLHSVLTNVQMKTKVEEPTVSRTSGRWTVPAIVHNRLLAGLSSPAIILSALPCGTCNDRSSADSITPPTPSLGAPSAVVQPSLPFAPVASQFSRLDRWGEQWHLRPPSHPALDALSRGESSGLLTAPVSQPQPLSSGSRRNSAEWNAMLRLVGRDQKT